MEFLPLLGGDPMADIMSYIVYILEELGEPTTIDTIYADKCSLCDYMFYAYFYVCYVCFKMNPKMGICRSFLLYVIYELWL